MFGKSGWGFFQCLKSGVFMAEKKNGKSFEEALWDSAKPLRDTLLPKLISGESKPGEVPMVAALCLPGKYDGNE